MVSKLGSWFRSWVRGFEAGFVDSKLGSWFRSWIRGLEAEFVDSNLDSSMHGLLVHWMKAKRIFGFENPFEDSK